MGLNQCLQSVAIDELDAGQVNLGALARVDELAEAGAEVAAIGQV